MILPPKPTGPALSRYLRNAFAAYLKQHAGEMLLALLAAVAPPQRPHHHRHHAPREPQP